jgi:hypothetical protein
LVSILAAFCVGAFEPFGGNNGVAAQTSDLSAGCAYWPQAANLEMQARAAAAAGDPRQYGLWKDAASALQRCESESGSAEAGEWFAYLCVADSFLSLGSEAEIEAGAPAILADLDRLGQTAKQPVIRQAAIELRSDVVRSYRYTRESASARVLPVLTPEPTISPILLRGGGRGSRM